LKNTPPCISPLGEDREGGKEPLLYELISFSDLSNFGSKTSKNKHPEKKSSEEDN
jgi:hypothetical protein